MPKANASGSTDKRGRKALRSRPSGMLVIAGALLLGDAPAAAAPQSQPAGAAARDDEGRWARELGRRRAELRRHGGRAPEAVLALLGAAQELEGELETSRLAAWFDEVHGDRRRDPLVRSFAGYQRALLDQARGHRDQARERLATEGYLLDWQVVGPFDNTNRKGEDAAYGPEQEPYDEAQTFRGRLPSEALPWRTVAYDSLPHGGFVALDDLLHPNDDATGYATCWVYVPEPTAAALHVGSGGPYRVWVDGHEVGRGQAYRVPHPLQDTFGVHLREGWNRVLVKVSTQRRQWGFFARLSAPNGAPLPALQVRADRPEAWTSSPAAPPTATAPTVTSLRRALERAYERNSRGPAGTNLVAFYRYVQPFDSDDDTAVRIAREVDAEQKTARAAWLHAIVENDPNEAFSALRRGIERARREGPSARSLLAQMLLELAWRHQSIGMDDRYRELVEEAAAVLPGDAVIELERIEQLEAAGFETRALERLRRLAARHPKSTSLALAEAARLHFRGQPREALARLEAASESGGALTATQRIDLWLGLGETDRALAVAQARVDASPGLPEAHVALARLHEARGDVAEAIQTWERAITLAPHDAEQHAELGRLLARHQQPEAAVQRLRRSLELRPQQPAIRDLLATLEPASGSDMFRRHALALEDIAKLPTPAAWKGKSAGVLRHQVAVRVLSNGLTERLDQRFIRVLDDRGVRGQSVQGMQYDPSESVVEVRRARVHRRNGTIEDLGDVRIASMTSAGYRMYYDQRQVRVLFDGLQVGDTLEVAFVQRDIAARNMFDEYFGDLVPIQGMEPRLHVAYTLEAPTDKPIYFNLPEVTKQTRGDLTTYRYQARDVAAVKGEPGMPGWSEVAGFLHASTYRTWDDVGTWYWNLVAEQLVVDDDIRRAVQTALAKLPPTATVQEKVDAIYTYVVRNTRYVGLEFGIHGYKPYRTTEVLSRRFGDCKDKASLLKVMLEEAGIQAHLVLVRTRDQGNVPKAPASLAVFNHAITYVPALDLFLDGTAEWSGPRELPTNDQGATVLVVKDGAGGEFRTIPVLSAEANLRSTEQRVQLRADGSARVAHRFEVQGASAAAMRHGFSAQERRDERLKAAFGEIYPGVQVRDPVAPNIDDIGAPAVVAATLDVPRWSTVQGDRLSFWALGRESTLTRSLAATAERTHPLVLDVPSIERHHLRYVAPPGYRFAKLPAASRIESRVGTFELQIETTDEGASLRSELRLDVYRVPPELYGEFRTFLRRVDESLDQRFELLPAH